MATQLDDPASNNQCYVKFGYHKERFYAVISLLSKRIETSCDQTIEK